MRARVHRPTFDRLDTRLVLSDSGANVVVGAGVAAAVSTAGDGSTQSDLTTVMDWYMDGSPPADVYDPTAMDTSWELLNTGN